MTARHRAALARIALDAAMRALSVDLYDALLLRGVRPELLRSANIASAQHAALTGAGLSSRGAVSPYRARLATYKAYHDRLRGGPEEIHHAMLIDGIRTAFGVNEAAAVLLVEAEVAYEVGGWCGPTGRLSPSWPRSHGRSLWF